MCPAVGSGSPASRRQHMPVPQLTAFSASLAAHMHDFHPPSCCAATPPSPRWRWRPRCSASTATESWTLPACEATPPSRDGPSAGRGLLLDPSRSCVRTASWVAALPAPGGLEREPGQHITSPLTYRWRQPLGTLSGLPPPAGMNAIPSSFFSPLISISCRTAQTPQQKCTASYPAVAALLRPGHSRARAHASFLTLDSAPPATARCVACTPTPCLKFCSGSSAAPRRKPPPTPRQLTEPYPVSPSPKPHPGHALSACPRTLFLKGLLSTCASSPNTG